MSFIGSIAMAQEKKDYFLEADVHLMGLGVSVEKNIQSDFSVRGSLKYEGGLYFNSTGLHFVLQPTATVEPRYYYNLVKREKKGKNTKYNAANFISIPMSYHSSIGNVSSAKNLNGIDTFSVGFLWNIRRNINNTPLFYELSTGLRNNIYLHKVYKSESGLGLLINAKLGFVF